MDASSTGAVIVTGIRDFGTEGLVVLGATVGIIVGLLVWRFAVRKMKQSAH